MTFVVCGDFVLSAQMLSNRNLGKQRSEAYQILRIISGEATTAGWRNHTAVKMWRGYIDGLKYYIDCVIREWIRRGYANTMEIYNISGQVRLPWWTQWPKLHKTHQAMLLRKDPHHYQKHFSMDPEYKDVGYIWPHTITRKEQLHAPLSEICAPIPKDLINPRYCPAVCKSGDICRILLKGDNLLCGVHRRKR